LWCKGKVGGIADLKGKKIRTYSATLGDFVEAVGGTSVTVAFAEVVPALEKGVVDCAVTGTMSAYSAKWYQVADTAYTLRVGWGLAFGAMNMDKWKALTDAQRRTLTAELAKLNDQMWAETATEDDVAISCITGGDCSIGEKGGMALVTPSAGDQTALAGVGKVVLDKWAGRCGEACVSEWNATVGKVLGMTAEVH